MEALNLKSDLRKHLEHCGAKRLSELSVTDYRKAFALFCTERSSQSGARRHANPIDFDADRMDPVFDLAATAKVAMLKGEHKALPALYEQIALAVIATVGDAVDSKCTEALGEIAYDALIDRDRWDQHGYEHAAAARVIRAATAARELDRVSEQAA
jgi:hypothetical protein